MAGSESFCCIRLQNDIPKYNSFVFSVSFCYLLCYSKSFYTEISSFKTCIEEWVFVVGFLFVFLSPALEFSRLAF